MSGHGCAGSVVAAPESGANIGTRSISASPAAGTGPLRDSTADAERRRSLGASRPWRWGRRIGEPSTLAYGVLAYVTSHHSLDFTPEQAEVASELIRVALQGRDLERAVEGYDTHLLSSIELVEGYDTHFLSSIELADLSSAYAHLEGHDHTGPRAPAASL